MGIGFVIVFWLMLLAAVGLTFLALKLLSKKFHVAGVVKDAFVSLVLVFVVLFAGLIVFAARSLILDNLMPNRIFTGHFKFSPPPDVQDLQGSNRILGKSGFGETTLEFRADKKTVERIINERLFIERQSNQFEQTNDENIRKFLSKSRSHFYVSDNFGEPCDEEQSSCTAILIYDETDERTYFSWL